MLQSFMKGNFTQSQVLRVLWNGRIAYGAYVRSEIDGNPASRRLGGSS